MAKLRELFGKKIVPHHMLNYAEQIYDILVGEIEIGRWEIDERLPGVIQLAKELGFGTKTIQTVYDRLKAEGYVRSLGYRGTYLQSTHPRPEPITGRIGVLVGEEQAGQPLVVWYEHVIRQMAHRENFATDVKILPTDLDPGEVNQPGVLFNHDIRGIISLTSYIMPVRFADSDGALPVVFLCPPFEPCVPKVCADVREAYGDLTSRVIRHGHTRILFSEDTVEPDPRQTELHREGYLRAMAEHGLTVDSQAMEASRSVVNSEAKSVDKHLKAIMGLPSRERPTAVVAGSLGRSMALARAAPRHGLAIPDDLSVVSIGSAPIDKKSGRHLTGMLPDFDRMIEMCLRVLDRQVEAGRSDFSQVFMRMHYHPGHTLAAVNGATLVEQAASPRLRHDIEALSRTVE